MSEPGCGDRSRPSAARPRRPSAHDFAQLFVWVAADPTTCADANSLLATCRDARCGFNVAVHAGWIPLAAHRRDTPDEDGATCRWVNGWWPVSYTQSTALAEHSATLPLKGEAFDTPAVFPGNQRSALCAVRVEHRLIHSGVPLPPIPPSTSGVVPAGDFYDALFADGGANPDLPPWCAPEVMFCETAGRESYRGNQLGTRSVSRFRGNATRTCVGATIHLRLSNTTTTISDDAIPGNQKIAWALVAASCLGVTSLGPIVCNNAVFQSFDSTGLTSVTSISDGFMKECPRLRHFNAQGLCNVRTIGNFFCAECPRLEAFDATHLRGGLESIGSNFFYACHRLYKFTTESFGSGNIVVIQDNFLARCTGMTEVDLSGLRSVTTVGANFLHRNQRLRIIDTAGLASVTSIAGGFAAGCAHLSEMTFDGLCNVQQVGTGFLMNNEKLRVVDLTPLQSINRVGSDFMRGCTALQLMAATTHPPMTTTAATDAEPLRSTASMFSGAAALSSGFLQGCQSLVHVPAPLFRGANAIGTASFCGLRSLTMLDTRGGFENVTQVGDMFLSYAANLTSVDLRGLTAVHTIGAGLFESCQRLAYVSTEGLSRVIRIGPGCFKLCVSLEHVDLRGLQNVTTLSENFAAGLTSLTQVDFGDHQHLTTLGRGLFEGSSLLDLSSTLALSAVLTVPNDAFQRCEYLISADLSGLMSCTTIGSHVFANCHELRSVNFGAGPLSSLQAIGSHCFAFCRKLETVSGLSGLTALTSVDESWFAGCKSLRDFDTRGLTALTSIGCRALAYCDALETVSLDGLIALKELPRNCFSFCPKLTSFDSSALASIRSVGSEVCSHCPSLASVPDITFTDGGGVVRVMGLDPSSGFVERDHSGNLQHRRDGDG